MDIQFSALTVPLFVIGVLVGIYSSVVGGGAIVLVPLFSFTGMPLLASVATMKACVMVHQGFSVATFWRERSIRWRPSLWALLWAVPGAFVGTQITLSLSARTLSYAVAACLALVYVALRYMPKKASRMRRQQENWMLVTALGTGILSIYAGFYGAGFSTFLMLFFWWVGGVSFMQASADASVVGFVAAGVSAYFFAGAGLVNWSVFAPIAAGGALGSVIGVELAAHYGFDWIRRLLQVMIVASILKLVLFPG